MAGLDGERDHVARVFASIEQKPRVGAGGISKQQDVVVIAQTAEQAVELRPREGHEIVDGAAEILQLGIGQHGRCRQTVRLEAVAFDAAPP